MAFSQLALPKTHNQTNFLKLISVELDNARKN